MSDPGQLISSATPTSPHLSRVAWLGEHPGAARRREMAGLFSHDGIAHDLSGAEFDAFRAAAAAARTAGGDVLLIASAAHHRLVGQPAATGPGDSGLRLQ